MQIDVALRDMVLQEADFYGVADLEPVRREMSSLGYTTFEKYPRGISIGIGLVNDIVDLVPKRDERWAAATYRSHGYDVVNAQLNQMALMVARKLESSGHHALPVSASGRVDDDRICGLISHKMVAHLAGLGWIGKSCLLVTPERGPRVRWITVLTDAPLAPTGKPMEQRCGDCHECVDTCPVSAFTGRNFVDGEPRSARFDAAKCDSYFTLMEKEREVASCGMCLYICPHGRKSSME